MTDQCADGRATNASKCVHNNRELEERLLRRLDKLAKTSGVDARWVAIARLHIEQGFMALNRAVLPHGRMALPEDVGGED